MKRVKAAALGFRDPFRPVRVWVAPPVSTAKPGAAPAANWNAKFKPKRSRKAGKVSIP